MRPVLVIVFLVVLTGSVFSIRRNDCNSESCKLPHCRCSTVEIPGNIPLDQTPQFVVFTFDDGVTVSNIDYYRRAFNNRLNRNGCPASATFFVSHEYTDYTLVQELYSNGHEIALHSITHNSSTKYWSTADVDQLLDEFEGERDLISYFTHIPKEDIKGVRLPFLQMSGDNSFKMMNQSKLVYDCSWPTIKHLSPGLWPYSLDYPSSQDCVIGPCPKEIYSDIWVMPMVSWLDSKGVFCSMVDTCVNVPESVEGLLQFMKDNFHKHLKSNRAPFGFYVHAAWFIANPNSFEAYLLFIDYVQTFEEVFITSADQVLNWVQNPKPIAEFNSQQNCKKITTNPCTPLSCKLYKGKEERWMRSCAKECPRVYPWVGNPLGK